MINFVAFITLAEGGSPHKRDGTYVLSSHGRVITIVSNRRSSSAVTVVVGASTLDVVLGGSVEVVTGAVELVEVGVEGLVV